MISAGETRARSRLFASPAPRTATSLPAVGAVVLAFLFAAVAGRPAAAQESDGTRVISDTAVEHQAPRPRVVFTDTPRTAQESVPALAHPENASDDFDNSIPTGWWIYTGQTVADVANTIATDHARIIDIEVDNFSPYSFTVTYVQNTDAYAKAWWWYFGITASQLSGYLQTNKARLTSLKAYDIGGGNIRFAVAMIANTGADARAWWWYYGQTPADITTELNDNKPARLIALDSYTTGGETRYTDIMIANTGSEDTAWWWWYNVTPETISSKRQAEGSRIIYLSSAGNGRFNAVMEGCAKGCSEWWWYYGEQGQTMLDLAVQNGARMVNLSSYPGCGGTCFAGAMINNSNAITTRVGNLIRNGGISGTEGLYLEHVNGPGSPGVLANLEDGVVFEPASTIKVLANLYSMHEVQKGAIKLTTPITHYTNGADSCPIPPVVSGTEPLGTAIREMMWHSDNARTREVTDHFGDTKINNYAKSIGLMNTGFHEIVGCLGTTPDMLTLDDAGTLYAGVANQDFLNAKNRGIFYSNMAGRAQFESEGYDWTGVWDSDIPNIISEVAPAGTTAAEKTAYMNAMNVAYKAGNYVICTDNSCSDIVEDVSIAGWFQLPVCTASGTTYAEYVWGIMFANEPTSGWSGSFNTPTDLNFLTAKSELMRQQIKAGMASCHGRSLEVMSYSPADLTFGSTSTPIKIGRTTPSKTITITNNQPGKVTGLSISIFGDFTETSTCGSSLASGKSCTISVDFTPTATGERTGAVIVTDDGTGQPQTIQLTGTGS
ncbi:MAG: serine hydrolase [Terracidiphilus sp.]